MTYLLKRNTAQRAALALSAITLLGLAACSSNDNASESAFSSTGTSSSVSSTSSSTSDDPVSDPLVSYSVTVTNGTLAQPLSPIAVLAHEPSVVAWSLNESASVGLEYLAEGGDTSFLFDEVESVVLATAAAAGATPPGNSMTVAINDIPQTEDLRLTVATMLVNTNDAFAGLNSAKVADLEVGEMQRWRALIYDAGTEQNTEAAGSVPGPADSGLGFDASRAGDFDRIHIHPGVVSADDGLITSILNQSHRFDAGSVVITVTRTQ